MLILASFRKALSINIGDELLLRIQDNELRVTTLKRRLERGQRLVREYVKPEISLARELIAEQRREACNK